MFGIILSALNAALGPIIAMLLRSVVMKFIVFTIIYLVVMATTQLLLSSGILPSADTIKNAVGSLPSSISYFMSMFGMYKGLAMIFSAYAVRFTIRRLPVIG